MSQRDSEVGLAHLPTELYNAIIGHLENDAKDHREFRLSLLALSRVIPRAPLALDALFRQIVIRTPRQAQKLFIRLTRDAAPASQVRVFRYECFEADADIVVSLLKLLQSITDLTLLMGPNFAPEHLEELFSSPRTNLKSLSLRFRPYVKKANYLQFMKGVYFDSTLTYLSAWPRSSIPQLSIVQDPLDPSTAPTSKFAQPIVFFRLDPISMLAASPFATSLVSMRFRIPSRQVVSYLHKYQQSFPRIGFLDISTCSVKESEVEALLMDLKGIRTLILDGCPIVSQRADALEVAGTEVLSQWTSLGKTLALVGVKRARQREKKIKGLIEQLENAAKGRKSGGVQQSGQKKAKKGRKGVANATFLIKDSVEGTSGDMPLPIPSGPSRVKGKGRSSQRKSIGAPLTQPQRGKIKPSGSSLQLTAIMSTRKTPLRPGNFRITPAPLALRSLAVTTPMVSLKKKDFKERYVTVRKAFEEGWASGIRQLTMIRDRMQTSWHTGATRVFLDEWRENTSEVASSEDDDCPPSGGSDNESVPGSDSSYASSGTSKQSSSFDAQLEYFFTGLHDITSPEVFNLDLKDLECPVLCLAGPAKGDFHPDGCPHQRAWELWDDDLVE